SVYQILVFFFFFQAEDGIRDRNVTGVQTCALPISWIATRGHSISLTAGHRSCAAFAIRRTQNANSKTVASAPIAARNTKRDENRSEERRVGKECRYRWSQYK